jgi:RNA polymerase sigma factor (TIGR02999 family)
VSRIEGITSVLVAHRQGQPDAFNKLVELVYPELRRIARRQLRRWRPGGTLDTGGVVDEAYLKLIDQTHATWQDRNHFFAIAARAMRQVIVDYARRRYAQKRGGSYDHVELADRDVAIDDQADQILVLDQLLNRLKDAEPRLLQVVECRFFAGYTQAETADVLRISTRTVERDWLRAKAWLREAMDAKNTAPARRPSIPARGMQ